MAKINLVPKHGMFYDQNARRQEEACKHACCLELPDDKCILSEMALEFTECSGEILLKQNFSNSEQLRPHEPFWLI